MTILLPWKPPTSFWRNFLTCGSLTLKRGISIDAKGSLRMSKHVQTMSTQTKRLTIMLLPQLPTCHDALTVSVASGPLSGHNINIQPYQPIVSFPDPPPPFRQFYLDRGAEEGSGNIAIPFLYLRLNPGATNQITERYCILQLHMRLCT